MSCHDGANHLEPINLYLAERRREEFWGLAAFLSRLNLVELPADAFEEQSHFIVNDRSQGVYNGSVDRGTRGRGRFELELPGHPPTCSRVRSPPVTTGVRNWGAW